MSEQSGENELTCPRHPIAPAERCPWCQAEESEQQRALSDDERARIRDACPPAVAAVLADYDDLLEVVTDLVRNRRDDGWTDGWEACWEEWVIPLANHGECDNPMVQDLREHLSGPSDALDGWRLSGGGAA